MSDVHCYKIFLQFIYEVLENRAELYGDASKLIPMTAEMESEMFGYEFSVIDQIIKNIIHKCARLRSIFKENPSPNQKDVLEQLVDICGYSAIGARAVCNEVLMDIDKSKEEQIPSSLYCCDKLDEI